MNNQKQNDNKEAKPKIISVRKTCSAEGTGLSHYVLMDKKAKK